MVTDDDKKGSKEKSRRTEKKDFERDEEANQSKAGMRCEAISRTGGSHELSCSVRLEHNYMKFRKLSNQIKLRNYLPTTL